MRRCRNVPSKSMVRRLWLFISRSTHKSQLRCGYLYVRICICTSVEFACAAKGLQIKISTPQGPKNGIYHADIDSHHPPFPQLCYPKHTSNIIFWDAWDHYFVRNITWKMMGTHNYSTQYYYFTILNLCCINNQFSCLFEVDITASKNNNPNSSKQAHFPGESMAGGGEQTNKKHIIM